MSRLAGMRQAFFCSTAAFILLTGCTAPVAPSPIGGGDVGVTAGGEQDIANARSQIESGYVPAADEITIEGFLSEHEIPLTAPPNPPEIYGAAAVAWRKPYSATLPYVDVFVGLGSTIDISSYRRRPQNLCVVVDQSGSMQSRTSSADYTPKLDSAKQAIYALIDQLDAGDQLAIIAFNVNVRLLVKSTSGDQKQKLADAIVGLKAEGNTNLFDALRLGYETVAAATDAGRDDRVILITDALPNEGPSTSGEFLDMQREFADQNIGFTMLGVGTDYGDDLAREISRIRGGNAFFLSDSARIASLFADEFDYFVTPAAFDLRLQLNVADGLGIRDIYGVADYSPGRRGAVVEIPTLFFSPRAGGGAIVVRLTFGETPTFETPVTIGNASLRYTLRDGTSRELGQELILPAGISPTAEPAYFSDATANRAALLLDTGLVLRQATRAYWENRRSEGAQLISGFLDTFDTATAGMSDRLSPTDRGLNTERQLLEQLLGSMYGYSYGYRF